jgi:hypothetical protein
MLRAHVDFILSFVPRSTSNFTDHGMRHSDNALTLLLGFTKNLTEVHPTFSFPKKNLFLLTCAVFLYDIGYKSKTDLRHPSDSSTPAKSAARTSKTAYEILTAYNKIKARELEYWKGHLELVSLVFKGNELIANIRVIPTF